MRRDTGRVGWRAALSAASGVLARSVVGGIRWVCRAGCAIGAVGVLDSCSGDLTDRARSLASEPNTHPNGRYVDQSIRPTHTTSLSDDGASLNLFLGPVLVPPEGLSRAGSDSIGRIADGLILRAGEILIVDDALQVLRRYGPDGAQRQVIGRPGQGPGEFRGPRSATMVPGALAVLDAGIGLQFFVPAGDGFTFSRGVRLKLEADDLCALDSVLVVQGSAAGLPILHLFSLQGELNRSFGQIYNSPNISINEAIGSTGRLVCDGDNKLVIYAPRGALGEVRAYRTDGTPVWRTTFANFKANRMEDQPGGWRVTVSPDGVHSLHALTAIPGRGLLVQWTYRTYDEIVARASYGTILSFLLDPATGQPIGPDTTLPPILAATDSTVLIAYEDPEPRFEVRALLPQR